FGSMFLTQVLTTDGMHLVAVADLSVDRAKAALANTGWDHDRYAATTILAARDAGTTCVTDDVMGMIATDGIDVIVDATGSPEAGVAHILACCEYGKHVVMVNVEADAFAGPELARRARAAGIVYSLGYGDQPALVCEMVDWARTSGFEVVSAGKGTRYLPRFHQSTPETWYDNFGLSKEVARAAGMNDRLQNSFVDGTKSAIEMAAIANATGLLPPVNGLRFPPCGTQDLARILVPEADGGVLERSGVVEVISSLERDGRPVVNDLVTGVYVVFEAKTDYARRCFVEYKWPTDATGTRTALYKPIHYIGLETGISVASAALRNEPTGAPDGFRADVAAIAKKDIAAGETLDGEGGYCVWGRIMPAAQSVRAGALPIGMTHGVRAKASVAQGEMLTWADVEIDENTPAMRTRREMEAGVDRT
ncbi:MAG: SAF domain-containing protein, partial [Pseudomonadota bacterium]